MSALRQERTFAASPVRENNFEQPAPEHGLSNCCAACVGFMPLISQVTRLSQRALQRRALHKMSFEIERKFLVRDDSWRNSVIRHVKIRQAYLDSDANVSIRVRIKNDNSATLTLKTRWSKLRRREFEYVIPTLDAEELMSLRRGQIIEKVRYIVPAGDLTWEIDVFSGENLGLVIAEIELPSENHQIELPSWIGSEVTGQDRYYNGTLARHSYCSWLKPNATVTAE
jgi:adenylate cyclase